VTFVIEELAALDEDSSIWGSVSLKEREMQWRGPNPPGKVGEDELPDDDDEEEDDDVTSPDESDTPLAPVTYLV